MNQEMPEKIWWAEQFEQNRGHLRAVAYRMLGSASEAEDAVQETWLRLSRSDAAAIGNLGGWLTTVIARVCLDSLRSRSSRREEALDTTGSEAAAAPASGSMNPEQEALMADSVGVALLVMLERLTPAERIAFVLHDMFDVSFDEIATIVGRSSDAARQLASRARRRVQGAETPEGDLKSKRRVVDAFLAALRAGDFQGLMAVLDPDVVVRVDAAAARAEAPREVRGAENWARGAVAFSRLAASFETRTMLVDGGIGLVLGSSGRVARVLKFTIEDDRIVSAEIIADPAALGAMAISEIEE